jgi:hypothetical protein
MAAVAASGAGFLDDGLDESSAAARYLGAVAASAPGFDSLRVLASSGGGGSRAAQRLEATLLPAGFSNEGSGGFVVFLDLAVPSAWPPPPTSSRAAAAARPDAGVAAGVEVEAPALPAWWPRAVIVLSDAEASAWRAKQAACGQRLQRASGGSAAVSAAGQLEWPLDASADRRCRALATAAAAAIAMQQPQQEEAVENCGGKVGGGGAASVAALLRLLQRLSAVLAPEPNPAPEELVRLAHLACLWLPAA